MSPEEKARIEIDKRLTEAGYVLQDKAEFNPTAALGVAVREFATNDGGEVDYALFIDGTPVGSLEAKANENATNLPTSAHEQNLNYAKSGFKGAGYDKNDIRFLYEATGIMTQFTDLYDNKPRTRKVFSFHQPEALKRLIQKYKFNNNSTLRERLQHFPDLGQKDLFRKCQIEAIENLEKSFAENQPRALIQMATGAGKTFTAITNVYRLLKFAKANRVLFLVDTKNLGQQAEIEFCNYKPYDETHKLAELYNIQRIQTSHISTDTKICISTIQRLYAMLSSEITTFADDADEESGTTNVVREVQYNKNYPPEFFDFIIIDECHRSIYNQWRQVLEYFDAFLIGLTATPNKHTYAFFNENIVSEYTHEQAVDDNVNVSAFGTYYIETEITKKGGKVEPTMEQLIEIRDKRTRKQRWESVDESVEYGANELDKSIVNKSQIRLVLKTFKDNWQKWEYFKNRKELPKTLIFAKDDSHANDIVIIARKVFGEENDFCKKITYSSEENEQSLLHSFRHRFFPRIAVTVNKIATGTDVKAIEILLFMRDIRSENYYEQMLGRARRVLSEDELKLSSPSAETPKLGYVIVDAVGVTKSQKTQGRGKCGGDTKPTVSFKNLLCAVTTGDTSEDTFGTLGTRLEHLDKVMTDKERQEFTKLANGVSLRYLSVNLKHVHDTDEIQHEIETKYPDFETFSPNDKEKIEKDIVKQRCKTAAFPINDPKVRHFLMQIRNSNDQTIDPALDRLIEGSTGLGQDVEKNKELIRKTFCEFIEQHKDEITALSIIYNQDYKNRKLTFALIDALHERMQRYNNRLNFVALFSAYEPNDKKSVLSKLVDIIQIIRYEWKQIEYLTPFAETVKKRYTDWLWERNTNKAGQRGVDNKPFTEEQKMWLDKICEHIQTNASIDADALQCEPFNAMGGAAKYLQLFGKQWDVILNELNYKLAV
jgi:type I restriction enzyme R subunit